MVTDSSGYCCSQGRCLARRRVLARRKGTLAWRQVIESSYDRLLQHRRRVDAELVARGEALAGERLVQVAAEEKVRAAQVAMIAVKVMTHRSATQHQRVGGCSDHRPRAQ
jgi:hypothetical protein